MQMSFMTSFLCSRALKSTEIQITETVIFKFIDLKFAIWVEKRWF